MNSGNFTDPSQSAARINWLHFLSGGLPTMVSHWR